MCSYGSTLLAYTESEDLVRSQGPARPLGAQLPDAVNLPPCASGRRNKHWLAEGSQPLWQRHGRVRKAGSSIWCSDPSYWGNSPSYRRSLRAASTQNAAFLGDRRPQDTKGASWEEEGEEEPQVLASTLGREAPTYAFRGNLS